MQSRTFVHIVCSPAQRAGVTTTARLFADYHQNLRRSFLGFDTDPHASPFASRFPDEAQGVDLAAIRDQVSLFDRLLVHDEIPKIVDLGVRDFPRFFAIAREVGFFEEAKRLSIEPVLFY